MGTRALIHIKDYTNGAKGSTLTTLYRQMDGYPDGLGASIRDKLAGCQITNGYRSGQDAPHWFNGAGCLAAYLIGALKVDRDYSETTIGNVYIERPGAKNMGEDYIYEVRVYDNGAELHCWSATGDGRKHNFEFAESLSPTRILNATNIRRHKRGA